MYKIYDLKLFDKYVEDGLLRKAVSECGNLVQYNYTDKCVYVKHWDEVTTFNRGNVYEISSGRLIARAFPKFFNIGELDGETQTKYLQAESYSVYEKVDGCLGLLYFFDGEWRLNSRGSFNSFASEAGNRLLEQHKPLSLDTECTYIFEIVSKDTKIILNYDIEELVLLGGYKTESGEELTDSYLDFIAENNLFRRPDMYTYSFDELLQLQKELDYNTEGFVVKLENGERFKVKSFEYLKIARIKNNCTKRALWHKMKDNEMFSLEEIQALPDELQKEVENYMSELVYEFNKCMNEIFNEAIYVSEEILNSNIEDVIENISEYAPKLGKFLCGENNLKHSKVLFKVFRNQEYKKYIFDIIEPKGE